MNYFGGEKERNMVIGTLASESMIWGERGGGGKEKKEKRFCFSGGKKKTRGGGGDRAMPQVWHFPL